MQESAKNQLTIQSGKGVARHAFTIAAEANLLRLPLFALASKGLKAIDGFECHGRMTRQGQTREFVFRTARSTATSYPGLLSRSAHLAFLSIITEHGLPIENPITWHWRDLCRRMEISPSGRTFRNLKNAIEATAGVTIFSREALYSKPNDQTLQTRQAAHLYDSVVFQNERLPDGSLADTNHLWLSGWYLDNLNSLFTAPLDHELWRFLDKRSSIASRLYEFLLVNMYGGIPQIRINYTRLAQFLPIRPEPYFSQAQKQLDPAFALLAKLRVTGKIAWEKRSEEIALIMMERGQRLETPKTRLSVLNEITTLESVMSFQVTEIRRPMGHEIVDEFYRLWTGTPVTRVSPKEIALANGLVDRYGRTQMRSLLPIITEQLKVHWPDAKTFLAIERYVGSAHEQFEKRQRHDHERVRLQAENHAREVAESRQAQELKQFEERWLPIWNALSEGERVAFRKALLKGQPFYKHAPHTLESKCLELLAKQYEQREGTAPKGEENALRTARKDAA